MAKLLSTPRLTSIHKLTVASSLSKSSSSSSAIHSSPTVFPISLHSNSLFFSLYTTPLLTLRSIDNPSHIHRNFSVSAFDTKNEDVSPSSKGDTKDEDVSSTKDEPVAEIKADDIAKEDQYPTGEFEFEEYGVWKSLVVKFRMLFTLPWERVRKGSVLTMKLRNEVSTESYLIFKYRSKILVIMLAMSNSCEFLCV